MFGDLDESLFWDVINYFLYEMLLNWMMFEVVIFDFEKWIFMGVFDLCMELSVGVVRIEISEVDIEVGREFWFFVLF